MPGLKRKQEPEPRGASDLDEPVSSLQYRHEKRARLSQGSRQSHDSSSSSDGEVDEFQATQILQKRRENEQRGNQPAEAGIVESVTCSDFMCHSFLHVELGPLINFIIGHNGSGKSAVLTALTISLGGKASATNRGGSLKSFIKEGQESCTLSVKIRNRGEASYLADSYGPAIVVERTFNRAGTSGFKLKSSSGKVVSTRKADLDDISDYFALQLDNPISVLSQDMARSFLNSSSPHDKYKFFVKGVNLDQLHHDYQLLEESIEQIQAVFDERQAHVEQLKTDDANAKSLLDLVGKQNAIRAKMKDLGLQMAWAQVEDQEKELEKVEDNIREARHAVDNAQSAANETGRVFDTKEQQKNDAQQIVDAMIKEKVPIEEAKRSVKETRDAVTAEVKDLQLEQRQILEDLKSSDTTLTKLKTEIEEEIRRLDEVHGGGHARRFADFEGHKAELEEAQNRFKAHEGVGQRLQESYRQAEQDVRNTKKDKDEKKAQIEAGRNRLQALHQSGLEQSGYPGNMRTLQDIIQKDHGYREEPVGPIGDYVQLNEPAWSRVLEKSFGRTLDGFIVTSKQDQDRLSAAMRIANCVCPIFIGSNVNFAFFHNEPDGKFMTVLRALKVDHPLVLRQLIINHAIEQTILINKMNDALAIMNQERLAKVKQCFAIQKADPMTGMRFSYGLGSNVQSSFIDRYTGHPRMRAQRKDQIQFEEESLRSLEKDLSVESLKLEDAKRRLANETDALKHHDRERRELKLSIQERQDRCDAAQDDLDNNVAEDGRLEALKKGMQEHQATKTHAEKSWQENLISKDATHAKMKSLTDELKEIDRRIMDAQAKVETAERDLRKADGNRSSALVAKNRAFEDWESAKVSLEECHTQREQQAERVKDFTAHAAIIGARVPVGAGETTESLDKKLDKLQGEIRRSEAKLGASKQRISEDCERTHQMYTKALAQYEKERALLQLLKKTYFERSFRWGRFRKYITARARIMFVHLLSERSFRGKLSINHEERVLDLNVQPDETQADRRGRQAKTLSGGEKSFSQICLLLALWEAIGAPIRCLDEFDVFMDSINRDASLRLLIRSARQSSGRQFILITPQSMTSIDREADVKIIKMRDPERNQAILEFPTN